MKLQLHSIDPKDRLARARFYGQPGGGEVALCYLKLNHYKEAEEDCNTALQLEPANIKAFYRRALAYKGLKCYTSSIEDLKKVLKLDVNVAEAQKELLEVTELLKKEGEGEPLYKISNQDKTRKNIEIEE
eukprot:g37406.t1